MSKISVLVAVYNAAQWLPTCLDSLLGQTWPEIEAVCIDDASTDASPRILADYARRDSRVKVLTLSENHGQAYARRAGQALCSGDFVTTLDADDWLSADALAQAMDVFARHPQTDCVLLDVREVYPDGREEPYRWHYATPTATPRPDGSFEVMSGREAFEASLDWGIHGLYVARARLYRDHPVDTSCRYYSDDNTTRLHYWASREVRCCSGRYYYRQLPTSTTHRVGTHRMDWMKATASMKRQMEQMKAGDEALNRNEWERWKVVVDCYGFYVAHRGELSPAERDFCIDAIRQAWSTMEPRRLKGRPTWKLGWHVHPGHWLLFRIEEEAYFALRRLLRR